jgi:uncharacterized protein DUF2726
LTAAGRCIRHRCVVWYVIGFIWLAMIAAVIWSYHKKQQQREAERARRFSAFLAQAKLNSDSPAVASGTNAAAVAGNSAPLPGFCKKQRLLPQAQALLYYVFRTGLPEHEIFANLTLADLIELDPAVRGYEREQKSLRLARERLDFVICTKQLEVVAAILLDRGAVPDGVQAGNARFAEECLHSANIRLVRINPAAPPRHYQVRGLVYGAGD